MSTLQPPRAFRQRLLEAILPALRADERIHGCWEGGSVATGRADAYSDIDLCLVVEAGQHAVVLDDLEPALQAVAPIAHAWRVEPPAFAGVTQRIYLLHGAPPHFAFDCTVLTPAGAAQFLERERHGDAVVYFDRHGTIAALPLDLPRHRARMRQRLEQVRAAWPVYLSLVRKELARNRSLDALGFYLDGLLRPLVELVGMRYRPERFDFGWRYLHHDLPADLQRRLEAFAYVAGPAQIAGHLDEIDRLAIRLMDELAAAGPDTAGPDTAAPDSAR